MSYTYQKYNSAEGAVNYTANGLNRMNFKIDEVNGLTDLSKSYNIFNVSIASTDYKKDGTTLIPGVVNPWRWGNNGIKYNASSLIRNIRLDSNKGSLENIINQNQWTQSIKLNLLSAKSEQKSQDIFNFYSGATHGSSSMFNASPWINYNTDGSIPAPTGYAPASVIMPLKETALGLAQVGPINLSELEHNNLSLRYELEDINNLLDLSWESTTPISTTIGQVSINSPRTLCYQEQFQGSYNQVLGQNPVYSINVSRPVDWTAASDGDRSFYPFSNSYGIVNYGYVSVSYMGADGDQHTSTAAIAAVATDAASATLQISAALPFTNNTTSDGGISQLSVKALVGGITDSTALSNIEISVPRPLNTVGSANCPFTTNMTIQLWGDNLDDTVQNQVYKITAITQTPPQSIPAGSSVAVDTYTLTLDSPLVLITELAATTVYMCPSVNATATWAISSPLLTLSTLSESHDMKLRRSKKTANSKTYFSTYEMESFTWSAASTNLMRQWILSPQTVCATLLSPLNGSLVSVRDNVNQIRVILGGRQLTNRPIILDNYTSAGSQYTDWLQDVLQHYAGLTVQQIQQIPEDAPGQVMVVPAGIQDMRFSSVGDDRKEPYILEYQLYTPAGSPQSAKTWYVFKTVVKHL